MIAALFAFTFLGLFIGGHLAVLLLVQSRDPAWQARQSR